MYARHCDRCTQVIRDDQQVVGYERHIETQGKEDAVQEGDWELCPDCVAIVDEKVKTLLSNNEND